MIVRRAVGRWGYDMKSRHWCLALKMKLAAERLWTGP